MENDLKEGWKSRARLLNSRPRSDGVFEQIPTNLVEGSLSDIVLRTLTTEWVNLVGMFMRCFVNFHRGHQVINFEKKYTFGKEVVYVLNQIHRTFFFNHLLKVSIFGSPLFCTLLPHELIQTTKNETVLHIFSHKRMCKLFHFGGLSASKLNKNGHLYALCGKANMKWNGRNVIGYIVDEDSNRMKIKIDGKSQVIYVDRPQFDTIEGKYQMPVGRPDSDMYQLSELWPIRLKLNNNGKTSIIFSIAVLDNNDILLI